MISQLDRRRKRFRRRQSPFGTRCSPKAVVEDTKHKARVTAQTRSWTSQLRLYFLSHCGASVCTTHLWLYTLPRCEALLLIFQGDGIEWGPHPYVGYPQTHPYQYPPSARENTSPVTPPLSHPRGSASKGPGSLEQPPPPIRPSRVPEPAISLLGGGAVPAPHSSR